MNQNNTLRQAIILGALLHDIGKFVQRANGNPKNKKHTQWGAEWFQDNLQEKLFPLFKDSTDRVRSAIDNHHEYEEYITLADAISAGMDRIKIEQEEEKGDPFTDRLISIFSRISISEKTKETKHHMLVSLSKD